MPKLRANVRLRGGKPNSRARFLARRAEQKLQQAIDKDLRLFQEGPEPAGDGWSDRQKAYMKMADVSLNLVAEEGSRRKIKILLPHLGDEKSQTIEVEDMMVDVDNVRKPTITILLSTTVFPGLIPESPNREVVVRTITGVFESREIGTKIDWTVQAAFKDAPEEFSRPVEWKPAD